MCRVVVLHYLSLSTKQTDDASPKYNYHLRHDVAFKVMMVKSAEVILMAVACMCTGWER